MKQPICFWFTSAITLCGLIASSPATAQVPIIYDIVPPGTLSAARSALRQRPRDQNVTIPIDPVIPGSRWQFFNSIELLVPACSVSGDSDESTFAYIGRGGTPPTPSEAISSDTPLTDLGSPIQAHDNPAQTTPTINPTTENAPTTERTPTQLVEAQGWVMDDNGDLVLTATPATATAYISWLTAANCHTAKTQS